MSEYRWTSDNQTSVLRLSDNANIVKNGSGWDEFLEYTTDGGQVDPWKTDEQIYQDALFQKLKSLRIEKDNRSDSAVATSDPRKKDKMISRAVKLLRREMQGKASANETAELDNLSVVDDLLDSLDTDFKAAETWLSDPSRSIEQINGYNVVTDPGWSTLSS
jgi:hypothetical protein